MMNVVRNGIVSIRRTSADIVNILLSDGLMKKRGRFWEGHYSVVIGRNATLC